MGPMLPVFAGVDFERGRLFDTADAEEARELCGRVFNPHQLRVVGAGQRLRARMDHLPLGPLSLNRLTWRAQVQVDPQRLDTYYLISMPVTGRARFHMGRQAIDVSPSCAAVVNAAERFHFEASEDFDQIVLRIERTAVEAAWQALAGAPAECPIDFAAALPLQGAAWRAIEPVLALLADSARGRFASAALPHLHARLQETLLNTLLLNQLPALLEARAAPVAGPASVRRAQAHMQAHLDQPLTVGEVARHCGVAVRTLQTAFRAHAGMGPMQWLREQRLLAVREALLRDNTTQPPRVTDTALRWGFTHLGEFSRSYRQRFGETPSATLARR
jgi:AraC-like DNA-binding protein